MLTAAAAEMPMTEETAATAAMAAMGGKAVRRARVEMPAAAAWPFSEGQSTPPAIPSPTIWLKAARASSVDAAVSAALAAPAAVAEKAAMAGAGGAGGRQ